MTCKGRWDPSVSEAGWRKNRSAQTLDFQAAETLGSPFSHRQRLATQVDLRGGASMSHDIPSRTHAIIAIFEGGDWTRSTNQGAGIDFHRCGWSPAARLQSVNGRSMTLLWTKKPMTACVF